MFGDAVLAVRGGDQVRRRGWPGDVFIRLHIDGRLVADDGKTEVRLTVDDYAAMDWELSVVLPTINPLMDWNRAWECLDKGSAIRRENGSEVIVIDPKGPSISRRVSFADLIARNWTLVLK